MTTTRTATEIDMTAKVASPEALLAARAVYPDAKRAQVSLPDGSRRGRDLIGTVITMGGQPVKILRATVAPIAASWGAMEDRDERGEYGYRATLIVSATAAGHRADEGSIPSASTDDARHATTREPRP